jgi:glyoxylase-like metal-dependent hydrolase (beta-lactamase superfamily II)
MSKAIEVRHAVVGPFQANCFAVKVGPQGQGFLIDPGDEPEVIVELIRETGLEPEAILLTHGHIDHANAAGDIRRRFRSRVVCHSADRAMVEEAEQPMLFDLVRNPCNVDQELNGGATLNIAGQEIEVIHTPGHTAGSVCYRVGPYVFTGDTLFRGSIGRTDLPGGSEIVMMNTLKTRICSLDDGLVVYPGHGPATTIGEEKELNPFLQNI